MFIESICVKQGAFQYLEYHQARMYKAGFQHVCTLPALLAEAKGQASETQASNLVKCRVLYDTQAIRAITFAPYLPQPPKTLKLIEAPHLAYALKYADRGEIEALKTLKEDADDILITQAGYITDTSYCNIAFFDGKAWFTPHKPLLEGTARARLLAEGIIQLAPIHVKDLPAFLRWQVFNAMLPF